MTSMIDVTDKDLQELEKSKALRKLIQKKEGMERHYKAKGWNISKSYNYKEVCKQIDKKLDSL